MPKYGILPFKDWKKLYSLETSKKACMLKNGFPRIG